MLSTTSLPLKKKQQPHQHQKHQYKIMINLLIATASLDSVQTEKLSSLCNTCT